MKIRTRPKLKPQPVSAFADLVAETCEVVKEYRTTDTPDQRKLSAQAFVRRAHANAYPGMPLAEAVEQSRQLEAKIKPATSFEATEAASTLRRFEVICRSPNWPGPPSELRRLNFANTPTTVAELASHGSGTLQLLALAALIASEQHPEDFGECGDLDLHQKRLVDLTLKRNDLFERIGKEWTLDDIDTSAPDAKGRVLQTFKMSHGVVPVHPTDNAGERLVNWMLAQEKSG